MSAIAPIAAKFAELQQLTKWPKAEVALILSFGRGILRADELSLMASANHATNCITAASAASGDV
jgi:hypothetical protein